MNKKIILSITLAILLLGTFFVSAKMTSISNDALSNKADYTVELYVYKGWNLVLTEPVFNGKNFISADSDIKEENIKVSYYYIRPENQYIQSHPETSQQEFNNYLISIGSNPDEMIYLAQSSVWIYSDKEGILKYERHDFPKWDSTTKLLLSSGWNFLSINPSMVGETLEDVKGDCSYLKAYSYSSNEGWLDILNIQDSSKKIIPEDAAGQGIVVKVSASCHLDFGSNSNINLPTLP